MESILCKFNTGSLFPLGGRNVLYFHQPISGKATDIKRKTSSHLKEEHIKEWVTNLTSNERQLLLTTLQSVNCSSAPEGLHQTCLHQISLKSVFGKLKSCVKKDNYGGH